MELYVVGGTKQQEQSENSRNNNNRQRQRQGQRHYSVLLSKQTKRKNIKQKEKKSIGKFKPVKISTTGKSQVKSTLNGIPNKSGKPSNRLTSTLTEAVHPVKPLLTLTVYILLSHY